MEIKRKKISAKEEQKIITNMITSPEFLKQTKGIIFSYLFRSSYARVVAGWCLEYFEKTTSSPGRDIQDIYIRRRKELEDEEEVELVQDFLQGLSDKWDDSQINNIPYEVSNTIKYMQLRQLEQLRDQLDIAITEGEPEQGASYLSNFRHVKGAQSSGVNMMKDADKIKSAFDDKDEILFYLHGDLGKAFGPVCRGDFVLGMGGPKSGKSYSLSYIGHRATTMGLKVMKLNFEMSEKQYTRREWQVLQGKPRYNKKIKIPYFEEVEDGFTIKYRIEKRKGIDTSKIEKELRKYQQYLNGGEIRTESFIEGESTFSDAVIKIENLEYYEDFKPDLIIWDYPDIMAHEIHSDIRHQIDDTYKKIRGYAQKKNCACVAVTQVGSKAWGKDIKGKDADENKKKVNHATKVYSINSTEEEMDAGIVRIQSLYEREGKRFIQQVVVLQCLDIGRFYLDSKFRKNVIMDE